MMLTVDEIAEVVGTHIIMETGWSDGSVLCACDTMQKDHSQHVAEMIKAAEKPNFNKNVYVEFDPNGVLVAIYEDEKNGRQTMKLGNTLVPKYLNTYRAATP